MFNFGLIQMELDERLRALAEQSQHVAYLSDLRRGPVGSTSWRRRLAGGDLARARRLDPDLSLRRPRSDAPEPSGIAI